MLIIAISLSSSFRLVTLSLLIITLFIYLFGCTKSLVCSMWDLIPLPRIEPRPLALGPWSLSHQTTRDDPNYNFSTSFLGVWNILSQTDSDHIEAKPSFWDYLVFIYTHTHYLCACAQSLSCVQLCNPMGCSPPGSSVHGIFPTRILDQIAISCSGGFSQLRDGTRVLHLLRWQVDSLLLSHLRSHIYICVYMCVCLSIYIHTHIHTQTHTHIHIHAFPCIPLTFSFYFIFFKEGVINPGLRKLFLKFFSTR